ncbi:MAG: acyl-CoA dehydrogenase family protein, partial [Actinobacteria bacterium]
MDVALTPEQEELVATVTALLSKESTAERVRAAEPLGFDDDLWRKLLPLELVAMALPESAGGYGGKFEDLVLVTEQLGRRLAPVPLIETIVTARVAAAAGEAGQGIVAGALERDARPLATALRPAQEGRAVLVPAGAVAPIVVGLDGDDLVAVESEPPLDAPPNLGCLPLADRDLRTEPRAVLASGADARALHERAVQEWKLLTAA